MPMASFSSPPVPRPAPASAKGATPDAKGAATKVDGRRARSATSRKRIIAALVDLIESGEPSPTAEAIAGRAGVSLRTVFRHFEEMENLHLEIAALVFERVRPLLEKPLEQAWPAILDEAITRRAAAFEAIAPYKTAIDVHRHRSPLVADKHRRIHEISRGLIDSMLPPAIKADSQLVELLNLLLSIESWQRLREQQGLDFDSAVAAIRRAAGALIASRA